MFMIIFCYNYVEYFVVYKVLWSGDSNICGVVSNRERLGF